MEIQKIGNLTIDRVYCRVKKDGKLLDLTFIHYKLLSILADASNRNISRKYLLNAVWTHSRPGLRTIDAHISRLRVAIGDLNREVIEEIWGFGYRLNSWVFIKILVRFQKWLAKRKKLIYSLCI